MYQVQNILNLYCAGLKEAPGGHLSEIPVSVCLIKSLLTPSQTLAYNFHHS